MEYTVNFAGYIGADETFFADSEEEALDQAFDCLDIVSAEQIDEDEWCVVVGYCRFIGVEQEYTVVASSEAQAYDKALEEARWDLEVESYDEYDEEY